MAEALVQRCSYRHGHYIAIVVIVSICCHHALKIFAAVLIVFPACLHSRTQASWGSVNPGGERIQDALEF